MISIATTSPPSPFRSAGTCPAASPIWGIGAGRQPPAYAVWRYGRSTNANQQAAVMLYVHGLIGDAAPGEVDPDALNPRVAALDARIDRDAARYHGPYRIEAKLSPGLRVGTPGS